MGIIQFILLLLLFLLVTTMDIPTWHIIDNINERIRMFIHRPKTTALSRPGIAHHSGRSERSRCFAWRCLRKARWIGVRSSEGNGR
jgi:hypothetical protein